MGKREIPAKTIWTCDRCGETAKQASRPSSWSAIDMSLPQADYKGNIVAGGQIHMDVCYSCRSAVKSAIDEVINEGGDDG